MSKCISDILALTIEVTSFRLLSQSRRYHPLVCTGTVYVVIGVSGEAAEKKINVGRKAVNWGGECYEYIILFQYYIEYQMTHSIYELVKYKTFSYT